jgi:chromosome segregation ATPase
LLVKLLNDQKKDDIQWGKDKSRLTNLIRKLDLEISSLQAQIASLKKQRAAFQVKVAKAKKNIAQYNAQFVANTNALNSLTLKRKQDKANYQSSVRDHSAIIGAIEQVIARLNKLKGSISGIGKPAHVGAIAQETRDAKWKASMKRSFAEIVPDDDAAAFAELATEADQSALAKLVAILTNILRNVKRSLADDASYEKESRTTYHKLKVTLIKDNQVLQATLKHQKANLAAYISKINSLTVSIKLKTAVLVLRQKELKAAKAEYIRLEGIYNKNKRKRNQEKGIIHKLQKIVNDRLARMSQFLKGGVNK